MVKTVKVTLCGVFLPHTHTQRMNITEERDFYLLPSPQQLRSKQKSCSFQKSKFYTEISIFLLLFIKLELMLPQKG